MSSNIIIEAENVHILYTRLLREAGPEAEVPREWVEEVLKCLGDLLDEHSELMAESLDTTFELTCERLDEEDEFEEDNEGEDF